MSQSFLYKDVTFYCLDKKMDVWLTVGVGFLLKIRNFSGEFFLLEFCR